MTDDVQVRGNPSAEEVAAVLAVVRRTAATHAAPDPLARWRAIRLDALRTTSPRLR